MFGNYAGFMFIYTFLHQKKKYLFAIIAVTLFASTLQTIKHPYRAFLYEEQNTGASYGERLNSSFTCSSCSTFTTGRKRKERRLSAKTARRRWFADSAAWATTRWSACWR